MATLPKTNGKHPELMANLFGKFRLKNHSCWNDILPKNNSKFAPGKRVAKGNDSASF